MVALFLSRKLYISIIENALNEDLGGAGDVTSNAIFVDDVNIRAVMRARGGGVLSGVTVARDVFNVCDDALDVNVLVADGDRVVSGQDIMVIKGDVKSILLAERVALNLISYMSGIATETAKLVEKIKHTNAELACTRKTTPGLRVLDKYAVRCGGGKNHRFNLSDAVLVKDNHIVASGSISSAVKSIRENIGHMVKIEVEVDDLDQLKELMSCDIDIVMLDNMNLELLAKAVKIIDGKFTIEASGGVCVDNIVSIAEVGVDVISCGYITHSAPILDIALDI